MQLAKNCTVGSSLICSYFCSAFFIGNRQNFIKKECSVHKVWTLTHQEITSWEIRDRDEKNSVIEMLVVRPQALDQSKRVEVKPSRIWLSDRDTFSKVCWLRSFQIVHIKQIGTMFQISEECRPNPFHQLNNKSTTFPGRTQYIPNVWNTQLQRTPATGQWIRRWSAVSPLQQHIQHQLAKVYPLLLRLSLVRILFHAAVQTKIL